MEQLHSIVAIETAINFWRNRSPAVGDELALCPEASALASVYGLMIYEKASEIDDTRLTATQRAALIDATNAINP